MRIYSAYGTGLKIYGIEKSDSERCLFTIWVSVLFMPIFPISSWSARFIGEIPSNFSGANECLCFTDLQRVSFNFKNCARTFFTSLILYAIGLLPTVIMLIITNKRATTSFEMIFVFASCLWAVFLLIWSLNKRVAVLKAPAQKKEDVSPKTAEIQGVSMDVSSRKKWRIFSLIWLFGAALILILFFDKHVFSGTSIPVSYLGYTLLPFGFLGLCGVNIWIGGPLDKRFDNKKSDL